MGHSDILNYVVKLSNEQIASYSRGKTINIWNMNNGKCLKTIETYSYEITILKKLSKEKIISSSCRDTIINLKII